MRAESYWILFIQEGGCVVSVVLFTARWMEEMIMSQFCYCMKINIDYAGHVAVTVKPLILACPLFCKQNRTAKLRAQITSGQKRPKLVFWIVSFIPCEVCSARYMPWSCVCLSQVGVLLKWLNIGACKQCHKIAQGLWFSNAKNLLKIRPGSRPTGAPNAAGVGRSWRISTNNLPSLENGTR